MIINEYLKQLKSHLAKTSIGRRLTSNKL